MLFHISNWGFWSFVWRDKPTEAPTWRWNCGNALSFHICTILHRTINTILHNVQQHITRHCSLAWYRKHYNISTFFSSPCTKNRVPTHTSTSYSAVSKVTKYFVLLLHQYGGSSSLYFAPNLHTFILLYVNFNIT